MLDERFEDLVICSHCGALHFDPYSRCPECDYGLYYQVTEDNAENDVRTVTNAAKAFRALAKRARNKADRFDAKAYEYELEAGVAQ